MSRDPPTISKSALLLSPCVYWAKETSRWYDESFEEDTSKRDLGTEVHRAIDAYLKTGKFSCSAEAAPMVSAAVTYVDQVLAPRCETIMSEVAIGINWKTGETKLFPEVHDRKYPELGKHWMFGTADIVGKLKDGGLLVADWKTGGTEGATEQLLSLGTALNQELSNYHPSKTTLLISCLALQEVSPGLAQVIPHERRVFYDEQLRHMDAMQFAIDSVQDRGNKPTPGIHCTTLYCPHLAYCEAVTGIVKEASEGEKGLLPPEALLKRFQMTDRPTSDEEAGFVMARVSAAKRQIAYYTSAMKVYVRNGGSVVCGNYTWRDRGPGQGFRWGKG